MVIRVVAEANLVIPGFEIVAEFTQIATDTRIELCADQRRAGGSERPWLREFHPAGLLARS
jgi:hypothetical protein